MSETDEARVRRYGRTIWETSRADESTISATGANIVARAVIAVANEEQAALRAEVERLTDDRNVTYGALLTARRRAEVAEAKVERLTRECLDREATETDARERLRRCEEQLAIAQAIAKTATDALPSPTFAQDERWNDGLDGQ